MSGFDAEDKNPSLGDPSTLTTTPLNQKQMQGAQKAAVNRTQLPSGGNPMQAQRQALQGEGQQSQNGKPKQGEPGKEVDPSTPVLGGIQQMDQTIEAETSKALGFDPRNFNPFHPVDYLKAAAESPVQTYYLGRHVWHALNAFFDPNAISAGMMEMQAQYEAWEKLHPGQATGGGLASEYMTPDQQQQIAQQNVAEAQHPDVQRQQGQADVIAQQLAISGDPRYLPMMMTGGRGALTVSAMLGPSVGNAIFDKPPTSADMAWALIPAMLLGHKLPPEVAKQLIKATPGVSRLIDKVTAVKAAQEANQAGAQDRNDVIQKVLQQGAQGAKADVLARAWEPGMQALTKQQHYQMVSSIMERYGTLDALKVMDGLMRDGAGPRMVQNVWARLYKMPYDFKFHAPEELPLVDPRQHMVELPTAIQQQVHEHWPWTANMLHEATLGPSGNAADPAISRFRSLVGLKGTNRLTLKMWADGLRKIAGGEAHNPRELDLLNRSLESSDREAQTAYLSLSPAMKYVRDSMRLVSAGLGMSAEEMGTIEGRVNNYWPRVGLLVKEKGGLRPMGQGRRLLSGADRRSRMVGAVSTDFLTESRIQAQQLYATAKDANAALGRQRDRIVEGILSGQPWYEIEQRLQEVGQGVIPVTDRQLLEQMHTRGITDAEGARKEAERYAADLIPQFSEDPFDGISKLGRQMDSIASRRAINDLLMTVGKDGREIAVERPTNSRAYDGLLKQGYRAIDVPGFQRVMVNKEYGDLLEKAAREVEKGGPNVVERLLNIENKAVSMIMYSPRIHGMNMALRLGMAFLQHPMEVSNWFAAGMLQKGGLSQLGLQGVTRIGHEEFRMIPRRYGLVPPSTHLGAAGMWSDQANDSLGKAFGDVDMQRVPLLRDMQNSPEIAKGSAAAKQVLGSARDLLWGRQSDLWSWVSDFGNMMWWIEYAAARRGGLGAKLGLAQPMDHEQAARYATLRGNSWMGHVSPVDSNPAFQAAARVVTFAPNWWRTWGELLTGYYRKAGVGWSRDTIAYVVENEIKTAAAALVFQQLSANALNMVLSGHTIYQNDPGNWGKVEVTQPWAIDALNAMSKMIDPAHKGLGIDSKTGRDAKGAKLTLENPLARQVTDTEGMMGLLTSSPQWTPQTLFQGSLGFGAARTSPVFQAIAALGNVDLYRSISSAGVRYVDPNHDTFMGNPLSDLITAAGDLTPFSYISQQIQGQVMQGNVENVQGPFGIPIPKAVMDSVSPQQLGADAVRSLLVGMTGVNPPYMRSSKTQGVSPTDDQYKSVREAQDKYQQHMTALSTSALTGQMAPYQWLQAYRPLSAQHAAEMRMAFNHAPEYNNGPLGLTNSWESLYDKATDKQGVLNADKLRGLQQQWRQDHSSADYQAVQNELRVNDHKYPMLSLYHKSLDAYDNWQSDWCQQNSVDVEQLRSDLYGYSQVYSDRNSSRQWLTDHPDITQFENAKKTEFESGQSSYGEAGLMYALFFNPTAADRYLNVSGETAQQVETDVQNQQVAAAS